MPELSAYQLLLFSAFVVPGAVSLKIYSLLVPSKEYHLKDTVIEAITFSVVNFSILYFVIFDAVNGVSSDNNYKSYLTLLFCFFVAPLIWPFLIVFGLKLMEKLGMIDPRAKTAWDHYFSRLNQGSFVIVVLNNDQLVGGKYGTFSYASSFPDPGHLFLEEVWEVSVDGNFTGRVLQGRGLILQPTDYKYVWVST